MDASYQDGSLKHADTESLEEAMRLAAMALEEGAETVRVYKKPHRYVGGHRRCQGCGAARKNSIHTGPR